MKKEGKEIIDIGPDFNRRKERIEEGKEPNSPFYEMERQNTKNYDGYQKDFHREGKYQGGSSSLEE